MSLVRARRGDHAATVTAAPGRSVREGSAA